MSKFNVVVSGYVPEWDYLADTGGEDGGYYITVDGQWEVIFTGEVEGETAEGAMYTAVVEHRDTKYEGMVAKVPGVSSVMVFNHKDTKPILIKRGETNE